MLAYWTLKVWDVVHARAGFTNILEDTRLSINEGTNPPFLYNVYSDMN